MALLKKIAIRIGLVLLGCLVAFICLELFVREFYPQGRHTFIADITGKIRTIHGANLNTVVTTAEYSVKIKTNAQGFVGDNFTVLKPAGTYRIAALGDSFTEGFEVDYNKAFPYLAEQELNAATGTHPAYQVYNFGMSSSGTEMETLMYKGYIRTYEPDFLVLQYYVGNDVSDDLLLHAGTTTADTYTQVPFGALRGFLSDKFQSPRFVLHRLAGIRAVKDVLTRYNLVARDMNTYTDPSKYPFLFDLFNTSNNTVFKTAFDTNCQTLTKLADLVKADNVPMLVVVVPTRWELYPSDWQEILAKYPAMQKETWDLQKPITKVTSCMDAAHISYINLYPILAKKIAQGAPRLYYHVDNHWNDYGNAIVADVLAKAITAYKKP